MGQLMYFAISDLTSALCTSKQPRHSILSIGD